MTAKTKRSAQALQNKQMKEAIPMAIEGNLTEYLRTILHLADTGFQIIQGQVANLVSDAVHIHGEGWRASLAQAQENTKKSLSRRKQAYEVIDIW